MKGSDLLRSQWGEEAKAPDAEQRVSSSLPGWMDKVRNRGLVDQAGRLWNYVTGNKASAGDKILVLAALLYLISPWDLVPDFLPVAGWLDDVAVASFVLAFLQRKMTAAEAKAMLEQEVLDPLSIPKVELALPTGDRRAVEYCVARLREAARATQVVEFGAEVDAIAEHADRPFRQVVFVGRFNAGKSTLINGLLGRDLLPVGPIPTTQAITFISHGPAEALYSQDESGVATIHSDVAELKRPKESMHGATAVSVFLPSKILEGGICFVDSPGLEDPNLERARLTLQVVPEADVLVMVLDARIPLSRPEIEFVEDLLSKDRERKLFFVLNKSDALAPEQSKDLARGVEANLQTLGIAPRVYTVSAATGDGVDAFRRDLLSFLKGDLVDMERDRYIEARIDKLRCRLATVFRTRLEMARRSAEERRDLMARVRQAARDRKDLVEEKARQLDEECTRIERRFTINLSNFFADVEQGLYQTIDNSGMQELKAPNMFADLIRKRTLAYMENELSAVHKEIGEKAAAVAYDLETEIAALPLPFKPASSPRVPIKPEHLPIAIVVVSYPVLGLFSWLWLTAGALLGRAAIEDLFAHVIEQQGLSQARSFLKAQVSQILTDYRDQALGKVSAHFRQLRDAMRLELTRSIDLVASENLDGGDAPPSEQITAAAQAWLSELESSAPTMATVATKI